MRIADLARAINCNIRTVRRLRQRYREIGRTADCPRSGRSRVTTPAQDRYIQTSHLRDRYRMVTTAQVTPGRHHPSLSGQTVRNGLNPIEHVWDLLGRRVRARAIPPRNAQELAGALLEEWDNISQQELANLV